MKVFAVGAAFFSVAACHRGVHGAGLRHTKQEEAVAAQMVRETSVIMDPNNISSWGPYKHVAVRGNEYECKGLERQSAGDGMVGPVINGLVGRRTCTAEKCFCFSVPEGYHDVGEDGENYDCFGQLLMFEDPTSYKETLVQHDTMPCQGNNFQRNSEFGAGSQSQERCYCKNTWASRNMPSGTQYLEVAMRGGKYSCAGFFRGFIEGLGFTPHETVNVKDTVCENDHCLCWTPGLDYVTLQPGTEVLCPQKRALFSQSERYLSSVPPMRLPVFAKASAPRPPPPRTMSLSRRKAKSIVALVF